jgi:hypothetical protein
MLVDRVRLAAAEQVKQLELVPPLQVSQVPSHA